MPRAANEYRAAAAQHCTRQEALRMGAEGEVLPRVGAQKGCDRV